MPFQRSPKLEAKIEVQLAKAMKPLWNSGFTARQIASKLHFGEPTIVVKGEEQDNPYAKLRKFHVWAYRSKFNKGKQDKNTKHLEPFKGKFPKRKGHGIKKGQPRYKVKHKKTMQFQEFKAKLNEELPLDKEPLFEEELSFSEKLLLYKKLLNLTPEGIRKRRSFLILSYWSPLRRSEIIERVRKDFVEKGDILEINLYRKKKYYKTDTKGKIIAKPEPFNLTLESMNETMVYEVLDWIRRYKKNERPFNFSGVTAWRYVKEVFPEYYPHFWRFSYVTKAVANAENPGELVNELLRETGLDIRTIVSYIMEDDRFKGSVTKRELKKLREEGAIHA
jgi:hypothetical protein